MRIGLTGKSCSGKNHIGSILSSLGCTVIDLDCVCHSLYSIKSAEIIDIFETLDRGKIAKAIYSSSVKRKQLEDILYPTLADEIAKKEKETSNIVVLNGALLYRADIDSTCKAVIYVDCPFETRAARAFDRNGTTREDFLRREDMQYDVDFRDVKYRCPVFVIDNSHHSDFLYDKVNSVLQKIKENL